MQIVGTDLTESILKYVEEKHRTSGGNCGTSAPELARKLDVEYKEIRNPLNQLVLSKQIRVRYGINSLLIFKPQNERENPTDPDLSRNE